MCVNLRIKNHGVYRVTRRNKVLNRFKTPWYSVTYLRFLAVVRKIDKNVWEAIS
jgi:hypothetical protein